MLKRGLLPAAIAALLATPAAFGATTALFPGVTYQRAHRLIGGEPVVLHIVRAPRHGGLYQLRPVLSHGTVLGRQTVPSMQRGLTRRATTVGVNGDFFKPSTGRPSGIFLRDGVLAAKPNPRRSALAIAFDGTLLVDRLRLIGSWRVSSNDAHPVEEVNRPLLDPPGVAVFTPMWGGPTPRVRGAVEVVLGGFPKAVVNGFLTGRVTSVRRHGGTWVPPGGAILQARGLWRDRLLAEAPRGTPVTVRLRIDGLPTDSADAIGGGPALVRGGLPIRQADEMFTLQQLVPRHPRTAVGQLADGRNILVVADGRSSTSLGLSNWDMAKTMADLGAVTAMAFDGGGSSTVSFNGRVLNRPSDGYLRPVANSLLVHYYGIYAPKVPRGVLTPNGDGVSERTVVTAKVVRRSAVDLRLLRPNGTIAWRYLNTVGPGPIRHSVGRPGMREGGWRWVVRATELANGRTTRMARSFKVDRTMGHLQLSKERMAILQPAGGRLWISLRLTRRAQLDVLVRTTGGAVRRVVWSGEKGAGRHTWLWRGRNNEGGFVRAGTYVIQTRATSGLGQLVLKKRVQVVRPSR